MLEILSVGSPKKLVRKRFGKLALGKGVEVTCRYSIKNDEKRRRDVLA